MATSIAKFEERERLAAVEASGALAGGPGPAYEFLAKLAAERLRMPMAAISIITADEVVSLAEVGIDFGAASREDSLCQYVIEGGGPLALEDAAAVEPYASSLFVTSDMAIRAYFSAPLITPEGHIIGAISVADTRPRTLGDEDLDLLERLADQVVANMERRRIERHLTLTVERLEHGERLANVGSWEWEPDVGRIDLSRGVYAVLGLHPDSDVTFESFIEMIHPDDRDRVEETINQAVGRGVPFDYTTRIVRPDGEIRLIEGHGEVADQESNLVMRGAIHDVTDREAAATDLRIRSELLDRVESAAVVAVDVRGRVTHWNHGAELMYGWSTNEVLGRDVSDLGLFAINARAWRDRAASLQKGSNWKGEAEIRRKDGEAVPAFLSSSVVTGEGGETMGYVGVSVDLTGAKRAEADLRRSREETIHRLSRAVEMRDMDTGGHIVRIAEYAAEIARRLGLRSDRIELIRIASPMHDVGKLGIADGILRKQGKLDPDELREMKRHTTIGYEILSGTGADVLEMAATIALTHHEWFDGTGYPRELAGEQIPLEGRIVAVADVYDALTSDRVYRKAFSHEDAVEMMRAERGTHFDPEPLDAMMELLDGR